MAIPVAEMQALVGQRFPGGEYRIEHWENYLLTEATGRAPMPDDLAHPIHLFHMPIYGAGMSIADLFALGQAGSDAAITIDYYDWEYISELREGETYTLHGGVEAHERSGEEDGAHVDSFVFEIDVLDSNACAVARVEFRWHFWRFAA